LSLGLLVVGGVGMSGTSPLRAETPTFQPWPPVREKPPQTPVAPAQQEPAPAVTLARPVPLDDSRPAIDSEVRPTGLFSNRNNDTSAFSSSPAYPVASSTVAAPVVSNAPPAYTVARPLPIGPAADSSTILPMPNTLSVAPPPDTPFAWRQSPAPTPIPTQGISSTPIVPVPNSVAVPFGGTGPGIGGAPIGNPLCDGCVSDGCGGCCPDSCCVPGCCDAWGGCGNCCNFGNRWYATAEYLLWFIRGQPLPPLVTAGSPFDAVPGALGQPGTSVLFGGQAFNFNPLSGGRFGLGYWFTDDHLLGIDARGFFLGEGAGSFAATSAGTPFLARPFTNALTGQQDIEAVATPNGLGGTVSASTRTRLWGVEANLRSNLCCGCNWFIDGLVGWRMLGLTESLNIQENLTVFNSLNPALPAGSTFVVADRFGTNNLFNGAQIGGIGEYRLGRWIFDVRSTVALGVTQQTVDIFGTTLAQAPGQAAMLSTGGLLAQSSNIGRHVHDQFTVVPEIGINVGYQFTNHIRGFVGYNFLYWSSVARPGNQIDTTVNPNLIPPSQPGGPQRPLFHTNGSDFWAQGIQFGFDIRW
jgi:hypothetical protein